MKINTTDFTDAINILTEDFNRYEHDELISKTDYEKGYVRGLKGAIGILKVTQRTAKELGYDE